MYMADQAAALRKMLKQQENKCRSVAVVSGKGGVGKSNFSVSFSIALAQRGTRVLVIDMDIGMGNIQILTGSHSAPGLKQYLDGEVALEDTVMEGPGGISYIAGGSGLDKIMEWDETSFQRLMEAFEGFQQEYEVILFDMGAGAAADTLELLMSTEDIFVLTTPEPTAVMDAYSMMKFICLKKFTGRISLICNRSEAETEGTQTAGRLIAAMKNFMETDVRLLGTIPEDRAVKGAVKLQKPLILAFPQSNAAKKIRQMAEVYLNGKTAEQTPTITEKLKNLFKIGRVRSS